MAGNQNTNEQESIDQLERSKDKKLDSSGSSEGSFGTTI